MKRKAIIIKGYSKDNDEQIRDTNHVKSYQDFFYSIAGGCYEKNEILFLEELKLVDLNNKLENLNADYLIVVFIGHGASQDDSQLFQLSKDEIIHPGDLTFSASKELLILESCRNIATGVRSLKQVGKIARFKGGGKILIPLSRAKSRKLYNQHLAKCEDGLVICRACSLSESAYGYFFIDEILKQSKEWHIKSTEQNGVLDIQVLFKGVAKEVSVLAKTNSVNQTPVISGTNKFPFVVSRY
ncbi:hypothetical protein [Pedobacter mucosus]|uniref:hypothetical protein n=1 Tax=Pedobacter mucosus TaxID=2895286 RepID=UPI001EE3E2FC|nr:hypothetical protein [Pedobacter mucosus]UKT64291.1 hypothetical protein LOK61_00600 [Pedobacter mucosus]